MNDWLASLYRETTLREEEGTRTEAIHSTDSTARNDSPAVGLLISNSMFCATYQDQAGLVETKKGVMQLGYNSQTKNLSLAFDEASRLRFLTS